jgi:phospholipid/cholesterol/gamma-HCH transport system permease protein
MLHSIKRAGRAYDLRMSTLSSLQDSLGQAGRSGLRASMGWTVSWWHVVKVGALIFVLALSPSTYDRWTRAALARHVYLGTMAVLLWFGLLSALLSVVLIRIVIVTALSYGLSQYALEMMVRVLVLELIPLAAALFVALRITVPSGAELLRMQARGEFEAMQRAGIDPLRHELLPNVLAGSFAVLMLATVSCLIACVLAYLAVHGFVLGAFAGFTRTLGHIFNPAVSLIFVLKTLFFSLAVALIPVAALLRGQRNNPELESLVRLFAAILLIEVVSLVSNYY